MCKIIIINLLLITSIFISCGSKSNDENNIIKSENISITENVTINDLETYDDGESYYPGGLFAQIYMDKKDIKEEELIDFAFNKFNESEYLSYAINLGNNKGIVFLDEFIVLAYYGTIDEYGRLVKTEGFIEIYKDEVKYYTFEEFRNKI